MPSSTSWQGGAYFFADPPEQDATTAAVFWDPRACAHVLSTVAVPSAIRTDALPLRLSQLPCRVSVLLEPGGMQHLLFRKAAHTLQLAVAGASLDGPVTLLTDAVVDRRYVRPRLAALRCLNELCASGRPPALVLPDALRRRRLRDLLRALDGWLVGAPYRDIAVALFGEDRADADWRDPRRHLRDRVRRAVRHARALMDGGYLTFLS